MAARLLVIFALVASGVAVVSRPVQGQAKRPMTLVDLLNIPRVGDPQLSPDGRAITFMQTIPDWKVNRRVAHLWRINTDGTGLQRLTNEPGGRRARDGRPTAPQSPSSRAAPCM